MANKNPLAGAFIADTEKPSAEPHARSLHSPTEKGKRMAAGRPPVEMPRGNGLRKSAAGRDMHKSSSRSPKQPGLREPSGRQKVR